MIARGRGLGERSALGALAVALFALFCWPFVSHSFAFPLGPDAPVYLWWTRLAGLEGLSAVGERPGVPSVLLTLSGALHLPLVAVTAGLEVALGVAVGLASAALVRERFGRVERSLWTLSGASASRDRPEWLLAGLLAGVFAVHLVAGYLANLTFAVAFLGACVCLAAGTRRGAVGAALVLGGGGIAHPQFFLLGAAILAATAVPSVLRDRTHRPWTDTEFGRIGIAIAGAGVLVGGGLLAALRGPAPPDFETSKDGLLRAAGLTSELRAEYVDRFFRRWARYVEWASVPLAVLGLPEARGFVGRLLRAWGIATVVGVVVGFPTAWFPADRLVTFGYVVPILAALGLARLARLLRARRPVLAGVLTGVVGTSMVLGAFVAWDRQEPFISEDEVHAAEQAGRFLAALPRPDAGLFWVESGNPDEGSFLVARAANVIRASVPPSQIRRVITGFAGGGAAPTIELRTAIARVTGERVQRVLSRDGRILVLSLAPFFEQGERPPGQQIADGVWTSTPLVPASQLPSQLAPRPDPVPDPIDPLQPSSPWGIVLASAAIVTLLWVTGYGWARWSTRDAVAATAVAPAFGAGTLVVLGVTLERIGVSPTGSLGPAVVVLLAAGCGYALAFVPRRRTRT